MLLYDVNCPRIKSFYDSLACPLWSQRLHALSIATTDCAVAIATARHCTALSQSSGKLLLFWPYDDGTLTSSDTNSLISKRTGPCYVKMNQSGHSVCSEVQPTQLMAIHLTEYSDISILDDTNVEYFRVDVGGFIMGWANGQLDNDSITQYDSSGRMSMNPVTQSLKTMNRRDWPEFTFVHKTGSGSAKWCLEPFITALLHPQGCQTPTRRRRLTHSLE